MKKRITVLLLVLGFALSMILAGCGEDQTAAQPEVKIASVSEKTADVSAAAEVSSAGKEADEGTVDPSSEDSEAVQASEEASSEESASEASEAVSADSAEASSEAASEESSAEAAQQTSEASDVSSSDGSSAAAEELSVTEDGEYSDKEHVALYIHEFGHLPSNYVTKNEAMDAGWNNREGNLNTVLPGKSIGGDRFGNYEKLLPEKQGRKYFECDIDFNPEGITSEPVYRSEKRIIYSNDGLVFYTEDHYNSFEQLY